LTAHKPRVKFLRINAGDKAAKTNSNYPFGKYCGVLPPKREDWRKADLRELFLPILAYILQEEISEYHLRDSSFFPFGKQSTHLLFVDFVWTRIWYLDLFNFVTQ